jgi:hypothetical protein
MSNINYVSIDRVFSKLTRDLKGTEVNETDVIEWIGEALDFLKVPQILVEDVAFLTLSDYHVEMPENLHMITQIARNNDFDSTSAVTSTVTPAVEEEEEEEEEETCEATEALNLGVWTYSNWTSHKDFKKNYTPVRLATGSFFNSIVCREKDESLYSNCADEYTIVGETDKLIRFNFIEGQVAVSYLRNTVDDLGYPLVPDNISYISAIVYYIKWKLAEMYEWAGRDGWASKAEKAEARWSKYARQAKNFMKMPKTLDQYQNMLEQTHYLIPNHKRYYEYFGNLNKNQSRNFDRLNKTY